MVKNNKILFIGNFLSKTRGSIGVTEKLTKHLKGGEFEIIMASHFENQLLRLLHIIGILLFKNYQIVHVDIYSGHAFKIVQVSLFLAKNIRGKRVIGTLHGGGLAEFDKKKNNLVKKTLVNFDQLLSPSNYLIKYFTSLGLNVKYLPNGVNLSLFNKISIDKTEPIKFSLLWVRAFDTTYNPQLAIEIVQTLKKRGFTDVQMTMIGPDRGLAANCKEYIQKHQLEENIKILGLVKNTELPKYYHSHTLFLNTTSYESFGIALIEAASCGLPIVTSSVGEIKFAWKDGIDALLVDDLNAKDFADKIIELFQDDHLRSRIKQNALIKAQQFDHKNIVEDWNHLLRDQLQATN